MKVIIIGCGRVGAGLAKNLSSQDISVSVIDRTQGLSNCSGQPLKARPLSASVSIRKSFQMPAYNKPTRWQPAPVRMKQTWWQPAWPNLSTVCLGFQRGFMSLKKPKSTADWAFRPYLL